MAQYTVTHACAHTDPRPFAEVLADWRARLGLTYEQTAEALGDGQYGGKPIARATIGHWLKGVERPRYEAGIRARMTLVEEGRA